MRIYCVCSLRYAGPSATQGNIFQATSLAGIESNAFFIYLLECIRACRKTLDIENAYYLNHPVIHQEQAEACRRGVSVRLLTNSAESNDLNIMNYRLYAGFPDLIDAGVLLYLRRGIGRTLHGKYFVADGEWIGFGSSNLDYFLPRFCLELGIQIAEALLSVKTVAHFIACLVLVQFTDNFLLNQVDHAAVAPGPESCAIISPVKPDREKQRC